MATTTAPYHVVNTMTGTKSARLIEDPAEYAHLIKRARRPLMVVGSWCLTTTLGEKLLIEYAVEIAKTLDIPICATAHTQKKLLELGVEPASNYDIIEILLKPVHTHWVGAKVADLDVVG